MDQSAMSAEMDQSAMSRVRTYFLSEIEKYFEKGNGRFLRKVFSKRKSSIPAIELSLILAIESIPILQKLII